MSPCLEFRVGKCPHCPPLPLPPVPPPMPRLISSHYMWEEIGIEVTFRDMDTRQLKSDCIQNEIIWKHDYLKISGYKIMYQSNESVVLT